MSCQEADRRLVELKRRDEELASVDELNKANRLLLSEARLTIRDKELELTQLRDRCQQSQQMISTLESELASAQTEHNQTVLRLKSKLDEEKNAANRLRTENADLQEYIHTLRYTEHPGNNNGMMSSTKEELNSVKNDANRLRFENDDLKSYVRSLRYAVYQTGAIDEPLEPLVPADKDTQKMMETSTSSAKKTQLKEGIILPNYLFTQNEKYFLDLFFATLI